MRLFLTAVWLAVVLSASAQTRFTQYYNSVADLKAATPNPISTVAVVKYALNPGDLDSGGVYYYSSMSVAVDDGITVITPNNGIGRWLRGNAPTSGGGGAGGTPAWINVKNAPYNAKGDGVTDDTVAMDAAIAALSTNTPVLYFPAGRYPRSTTMTIPTFKGWSIIGNSRFDTQILYSGATNAIYVGAALGNSAQLHALIKDISIVANGSGANANGLHIANCYKVQIINVAATGFGNAGVLIDPLQVSDQVGIIQLTSLYTTGNKYGLKIGHTSNNIHDIHLDGDSDFDGNTQYNLWMWANAFGFDIKGNSFYFGPNSSSTNIYIDSIGGGTIQGNYIEGGQAAVVFANSGGSTVPPAAISFEGNGIQGSHTNSTAVQYGISASDRLNAISARNNWITGFTNGFNFIGIVNNSLIGPNYFTASVTNQYGSFIAGSSSTIVNSNFFMPGIRVGTNGTFNFYDTASQGIMQIEALKEFVIFDNVTGLTRAIAKTNGNWGFSTASPTAPFSVNSAMDVKGITNLSGVVDVQGGNNGSVANPGVRIANNRMITFSDAAGGNTAAAFLWKKTDDSVGLYNGNSSSKGISIDATTGDVTSTGGNVILQNNKFHKNKDSGGTIENVIGIDSANNLILSSPSSGGGEIIDVRKGDQTLKARFETNVIPWTLSSNLFAITAPFTASQGAIITGGTTNVGDGTQPGGIRLVETNGVNSILIQGRNQLNASITNNWPGTNAPGYLTNDGVGGLAWVAGGSGGSGTITNAITNVTSSAGFTITRTGGSGVTNADVGLTTDAVSLGRLGLGTAADANNSLQIGLGTITSDKHALDITGTWNSAGTTFTGIKANFNNTNSASGTLLMDFQVDSVSKFDIRKDGIPHFNIWEAKSGSPSIYSAGGSLAATFSGGAGAWVLLGSSADLYLVRDSAATLQLGLDAASVVTPQNLKAADGSGTDKAGADFQIEGGQGTGLGSGGAITIRTAPAGASTGSSVNAYQTRVTFTGAGAVAWQQQLPVPSSQATNLVADFNQGQFEYYAATNDIFFLNTTNRPADNTTARQQRWVITAGAANRNLQFSTTPGWRAQGGTVLTAQTIPSGKSAVVVFDAADSTETNVTVGVTLEGGVLYENVVNKTGNYNIASSDSGTTFDNQGASAQIVYTIPSSLPTGFKFQVSSTSATAGAGSKVTCASGETIRNAANLSALAGSITNQFGFVYFVKVNSTNWNTLSIGTQTIQ